MNDFRADLHCHTTCSDGTFKPKEIIQLASKLGLQGLSITDHDTIEAYQEAVPAAQEHQIQLISGVEFSAVHRNTNIHLLGYSFPLSSPVIQSFCEKHYERRINRNQAILDLLNSHGMPLSEEDLYQESMSETKHSMGRPHIALAMIKKGYVSSIQQAFQQYIGEGKSCYASGDPFSVEETIEKIHQGGGLAVIAHPHLIENQPALNDLLQMPFDGIEGYYARFPPKAHERWVKIGMRKGWLITGGSDFHGENKSNIPLGSSWVGQETFQILQQHFQKQS